MYVTIVFMQICIGKGNAMRQLRSLSVLFLLAVFSACGRGGSGTPGGSAATLISGTNQPQQNSPVMTNRLSGKVVDTSGRPVAGVTISVFHHNENATVSTVTDADGNYAVSGQNTGRNSDYAIYAE